MLQLTIREIWKTQFRYQLPLFGCHAKQCDVQDVGLRCINQPSLGFGDSLGNNVLSNCISMDAVIDFAQRSGQVPFQRTTTHFFVFKPLKFFDKKEFEFR